TSRRGSVRPIWTKAASSPRMSWHGYPCVPNSEYDVWWCNLPSSGHAAMLPERTIRNVFGPWASYHLRNFPNALAQHLDDRRLHISGMLLRRVRTLDLDLVDLCY